MKQLIHGAAIRISRPTESTIKVEILKRGDVIYEFPVQPVGLTESVIVGPLHVEVEATLV